MSSRLSNRMILEKLGREPELSSPGSSPGTTAPAPPSPPVRYKFQRLPRLGPGPDAIEKALLLELLDLGPQNTGAAAAALSLAEKSLTDQLEAFLAGHLHLTASHRLYERETICTVRSRELVFHRLVALLPEGEVEAGQVEGPDVLPVEALTLHPYRILRARLPRPFERRGRAGGSADACGD